MITVIRKADSKDREAIVELFKQLVSHHVKIVPDFYKMPEQGFFENEVNCLMTDENKEIWVNDDNEINAYAVISFVNIDYSDRYPYKMCFINCFGVKEECRHSGIGSALMDAGRKRAAETGCRDLQLKANITNKDALSFYEKKGFMPHEIVMREKI